MDQKQIDCLSELMEAVRIYKEDQNAENEKIIIQKIGKCLRVDVPSGNIFTAIEPILPAV